VNAVFEQAMRLTANQHHGFPLLCHGRQNSTIGGVGAGLGSVESFRPPAGMARKSQKRGRQGVEQFESGPRDGLARSAKIRLRKKRRTSSHNHRAVLARIAATREAE
jgi:hypothetical protein